MDTGLLKPVDTFVSGERLDSSFFDRLNEMASVCYSLQHAVGQGILIGDEGGVLTLEVEESEPVGLAAVSTKFYALIGASPAVVVGGANRWTYAWAEAQCDGTSWSALSGGRSGTTTSDPAYNRFETINAAAGQQGNGVTIANLLGSFTVQPIPQNVVVEMDALNVGGTLYYWFAAMNGVDGACA